MPRNSEIKVGRWPMWSLFTSQHQGPNFDMKQIFEKFWKYAKDAFACFVDLEKAYDRVARDKLWRVLQEYDGDGHQLIAIKSLH